MSKENAKKLIAELQTNEELKAKIKGITDPAQLVKIAADAGYDVTAEELIEADRKQRAEQAANTDEKLSIDDLEGAAGGAAWRSEDAPDGHEMGCFWSYHGYSYQQENGLWCNQAHYCNSSYESKPDDIRDCH